MKKAFFFLVASVLFLGVSQIVYLYTHQQFKPCDFSHKIVKTMKWDVVWDAESRALASAVVQQPFRYLGEGKQMTAYSSDDGRYVVKFFNPRLPLSEHHFSSVKRILRFCSLHWLSSTYFHKEQRLSKLFKRYQIAANPLREETATLWVHLNPETALHQAIQIVDRDGTLYSISLDSVPFVIQYRAELASDRLRQILQTGDKETMRSTATQIIQFFTQRAEKGYTDRIQTLHNNYGFIGERFIQIDPGRLIYDPHIAHNVEGEVERILSMIRKDWPALDI